MKSYIILSTTFIHPVIVFYTILHNFSKTIMCCSVLEMTNSKNVAETVSVRPYHWETRVIEGKEELLAHCLRRDGHKALLRVKNFRSRAFLQLPQFMIDCDEKVKLSWSIPETRETFIPAILKEINRIAATSIRKSRYGEGVPCRSCDISRR